MLAKAKPGLSDEPNEGFTSDRKRNVPLEVLNKSCSHPSKHAVA